MLVVSDLRLYIYYISLLLLYSYTLVKITRVED